MDYKNILVGQAVIHRIFKKGIITDCSIPYIIVSFPEKKKIIKMQYPEAFKRDISAIDKEVDKLIKRDIQDTDFKKKLREEELKKKKAAEDGEKRWHELNAKIRNSNDTLRKFRPFKCFNDFVSQYEKSLEGEICHLQSKEGKRYRFYDGIFVKENNGQFRYSFEADTEYSFTNQTQIHIYIKEEQYVEGHIVCSADNLVLIDVGINLGKKIDFIEFSTDSWRLLDLLIKRLQDLQQIKLNSIAEDLVCNGRKKVQYGMPLVCGQENACMMALTQPITFIWGPPGTGKTETLAKIAIKHMENGHRILMLSYSNVSVDGAILRVYKNDGSVQPGELIRYGYPKDKTLIQHEYLTAHNYVIHKHPSLLAEQKELYDELENIAPKEEKLERYWEIQERLDEIRQKLATEEKQTIYNAKFLATTVSKAIVDKNIYESSFDVVIFDEASMAYLPQVVFAAGLARKHFICMGDFSQLPPIVQSESESILNVDVFQYCGIRDAVESKNGHEWLCVLNTQYRMHPDIAQFASKEMYHSLLKSADGLKEKRQEVTFESPLSGLPIGIADLSGMMSTCINTTDYSHINILSAFISIAIAADSARNNDVGIIVPYQAQARLLNTIVKDLAVRNKELRKIECATVHQFQGSEKDVIIYDAVDCYIQRFPGRLLTLRTNDYANRLFNVALTRTKGKFVTVVNIDYMWRKKLSKKLMYAKLLEQRESSIGKIFGNTLIECIKQSAKYIDGFDCYDKNSCGERIINDIVSAKKEIRIDVSGNFIANDSEEEKLCENLEKARQEGVKIVVRTNKKENIPLKFRASTIENSNILESVIIVDRKIIWFGNTYSNVHFVTDDGPIETKYYPIIRFEGTYTARAIFGFLEMNKTFDMA